MPKSKWTIFYILQVEKTTSQRLLRDENPIRYLTINNINISAYVAQLHIFSSLMNPLDHIATMVDNTTVYGC